jgi:hypothetical protein
MILSLQNATTGEFFPKQSRPGRLSDPDRLRERSVCMAGVAAADLNRRSLDYEPDKILARLCLSAYAGWRVAEGNSGATNGAKKSSVKPWQPKEEASQTSRRHPRATPESPI